EIPAEDIEDIVFQVLPLGVRVGAYRPATVAEKTALTTAKDAERTKALAEALAKYEEALPGLDAGQPFAKSHIEYKIAFLRYLQARESGQEAALQKAAARLEEFKTRHPQAWQLSRCLRLLAQVQLDLKQFDAAEKTYLELARADVADEVRQEAEVQAVLVTLQSGRPGVHAAAQAKLQALVE